MAVRVIALWLWSFGVWVLLTWTRTLEVLTIGAGISLAVAVALAPMGAVVPPWRLLAPRRVLALVVLVVAVSLRVVRANLWLARRIWAPDPALATGMLTVPTRERTEGGLAAVGLLSSLIVDNQLVDLDAATHELLYHAVVVPAGDAYEAVNGPLERLLAPVEGRR